MKKNFSWIFAGNLMYALSKAFILLLLAKTSTVELVGQYSLALTITTTIFVIFDLGLSTVYVTDVKEKYDFNSFFQLRLINSTLSIFISFIVAIILRYNKSLIAIIVVTAFWKALELICDIVYKVFQKQEHMDIIGKSKIMKSLLSSIAIGIVFLNTKNLISGLLSIVVVWLIIFLGYDVLKAWRFMNLKWSLNVVTLRKLIKFSIPLSIIMICDVFNSYIPNYFIKGFLDIKNLGYYSSLSYIILSGDILINALGQTSVPRLVKSYFGDKYKTFTKTLGTLITMGLALGSIGLIIISFAGKQILTLLYKPEYANHTNLFILLMIASSIIYTTKFLNNATSAARKFREQQYMYIIVLICNVIISSISISTYGLLGVGYAAIIIAQLKLLGSFIIYQYYL